MLPHARIGGSGGPTGALTEEAIHQLEQAEEATVDDKGQARHAHQEDERESRRTAEKRASRKVLCCSQGVGSRATWGPDTKRCFFAFYGMGFAVWLFMLFVQ